MQLRDAIARVCAGRDLSADEMAGVVGAMMEGAATPAQIGGLLVALRQKGETLDELVGAARALRARAVPVVRPEGVLVDTCGTGGDGRGTVNVSTLAALVVAACGVRVAKHGNRAVSSRAGSADLLEALGIDVAAPPAVVERCLLEHRFGFFFAPAYHGATRQVAEVRRELGVRTLFNLIGPLSNPAGVRHQVVGVFDGGRLELMARALGRLGAERALVVHGAGGLDEFSPTGQTEVAELRGEDVKRYKLSPRDFALDEGDPLELRGGDAGYNARVARAMLGGAPGAVRTVVVMTAGAALYAAGATGLRDGARRAEAAIDDGSAARLVEQLATTTRPATPVSAS